MNKKQLFDGRALDQALGGLDPARTLILVTSKTFTTHETLHNAGSARRWLEQGLGAAKAQLSLHLAAATASPAKAQDWGVAKDRVLAFLQSEAVKSRESATTISNILARISATCAIGDRARTIEAMLDLQESFADIELPITSKPLEVR